MNQAVILGIVRHALTFLGGYAVTRGYIDSAGLEIIVGAVLGVAGVIWSALDKKNR